MADSEREKVQRHSVHTLVFRSLKRSHDMFLSDQANLPAVDEGCEKLRRSAKAKAEYGPIMEAAKAANKRNQQHVQLALPAPQSAVVPLGSSQSGSVPLAIMGGPSGSNSSQSQAQRGASQELLPSGLTSSIPPGGVKALLPRKATLTPKPQWHAPWKLYRVISGHTGWVRCIDVEPANQWFCTGAADRIIKIWDLATGTLKLSLTGHVSAVRALKVSARQPYLFSAGEDKKVMCWDLEQNKVVRQYHGHLSAVNGLALHPTIDILVTCSRDATVRIWDMRTKANIHTFTGHDKSVESILVQAAEPQIISGSHDNTIRLWDLAAGKSRATLTNHKKSVRALCMHPTLYMFASASPDNIKQWKCPAGEFVANLSGHTSIINALAVNDDNVMVSGAGNGSMHFWDWKTGFTFQKLQTKVQPGSIDSEAGIFAMNFDHSGSRLITAEADKTVKLYKEDENATEDTHPLNWKPEMVKKKIY